MTLRIALAVGAFLVSVTSLFAENDKAKEKPSDIPIVAASTNAVQTEFSNTLAGYLAVLVRSGNFERMSEDADLGPSIQLAVDGENDMVVVLVPPEVDRPTYSIVFSRTCPVTLFATTSDNQRESFKIATCDIPEGPEELMFQDVSLTADDGTPVPAMRILSAGPR